MNQIKSEDIKSVGLFSFGFLGIYILKKTMQAFNKNYQFFERGKIKDGSQIQKLKQGQKDIFKVQIVQSEIRKYEIPLYLNEALFYERSDGFIIYMASLDQLLFKKWKVKGLNGDKVFQINGAGQVMGDIFEIRKIKNIDPDYVNLSQSKFSFSYYYQKILQFIFSRKQETPIYNKKPFTFGPKIGSIINYVNLVKNSVILLQCKYEDGKLKGCLVSPSIQQIQKFISGFNLMGTILMGICFYSIFTNVFDVMRFGKKLYKKLLQNKNQKVILRLEQVSDEKICIICYEKNRNIIIFDCRHLIMCSECLQTFNYKICPICRQKISDVKYIRSI